MTQQHELRFWPNQKSPRHGLALLESVEAIDGPWQQVLPTRGQLVDCKRVFPNVVDAYETLMFRVCALTNQLRDAEAEIAALREVADAHESIVKMIEADVREELRN